MLQSNSSYCLQFLNVKVEPVLQVEAMMCEDVVYMQSFHTLLLPGITFRAVSVMIMKLLKDPETSSI